MKTVVNKIILYMPVIICILLIVYADTTVNAGKQAVSRCLEIIIPSLFAFMAFGGLLIKSGAYKMISLPFYPLARFVFKMPYELFSVFLISNLAGFPVGAAMLKELTEQKVIDKKTASVMQCFCYGGGPSFSVGVIGLYIFGNKKAGIIICLSAIIVNMIAAIILCRLFTLKANNTDIKVSFNTDDIIKCTEKAGSSILMICALIILFSIVMAISERVIGANDTNNTSLMLIRTIFELSSITGLNRANTIIIPVIAALFSFGGICIIFQCIYTVKSSYSLSLFFITRLPISLLSFGIAKVLCSAFLDKTEPCFATSDKVIVNFNNFIPSICLILMIFLLLFKKGVAIFRDI